MPSTLRRPRTRPGSQPATRRKTSLLAEQRGQSLADAKHAHAERLSATFPDGVGELTWSQRLDILDGLELVLDGAYAHLPLKRSLYGFDPIRALEHLRQQVPALDSLQFHREMTSLVNRLRDAHTQYYGPTTLEDAVARLPFLVEAFGPDLNPSYLVTKISDRRLVDDPMFVRGVELTYWNGVPFNRAVELHADRETGGRPDARRARALDSLTFRSLQYNPPPDEEWVVIGYRGIDGGERETHFDWRVVYPKRAPVAASGGTHRARRAINPAAEAVRRAKKLLFNPQLWEADFTRNATAQRQRGLVATRFQDALSAKRVETRAGKLGYLRIWTFDVDDDEAFVRETIRILNRLPDRGLIIDLRDNPGGVIWSAERMLQLFTPRPITPTKFALRATRMTAALADAPLNQSELGPWSDSLNEAALTGEPYSVHLPITSVEQCNDIGQTYGGPIAVIVDANTYSCGDLFTAGVVDNRIGPVLCVGTATGAGGANVWSYNDVRATLPRSSQPPKLPDRVDFTLAIRRAVRSGDADGVLIEDAGIAGQPYAMTKDDVLHSNRDLIERAAELVVSQPLTRLRVKRDGTRLELKTAALDRLDVLVNGHPDRQSIAIESGDALDIRVAREARNVEIVGFADGVVRQRRRLVW